MTEPTLSAEPWLALPIPAGIPATVTAAAQEAARQVIGCWTLTSTLPGPSLPPVMHEVHAAVTDERMQKAREYIRKSTDLRGQRDWALEHAAILVARVRALDEQLDAIEDGAAQALLDRL